MESRHGFGATVFDTRSNRPRARKAARPSLTIVSSPASMTPWRQCPIIFDSGQAVAYVSRNRSGVQVMFAVMGATGNTGQATGLALLEAGETTRVVGRSLEKLADFALAGAELAIADSLDSQALTKAFEGTMGVYAMVGIDPTVDNYDAHYDAIGEAITAAVLAAGISYVVELSGIGSHLPANSTEAMGAIDAGRRHEVRLDTLTDVNVVHLRPGFFMENFLRDIPTLKKDGVIRGPLIADQPIAMISARDIGERAASLLRDRYFVGEQAYDLLGPADVTPREAANIFAEAIGVDHIDYVAFSLDEFHSAMIAGGVSESCAAAIAGIYEGYNSGRLTPEKPRNPESSTPTTIAEFATTFADVYRVAP